MAGQTGEMRGRVAALLAAEVDRGALWRQLAEMAYARGFVETADLWAPALYDRDAAFFEPFLLKYLHTSNEATIRVLLPRCETAGQAALFTGLYRKIMDDETWNHDVLTLAQAASSDDALEQALALREPGNDSVSLDEETALALYRRNPRRFSDYVRDHIHHTWRDEDTFPQLRAEARVRGDDPLYWALFRELASADEWRAALNELLKDDVPAEAIAEELGRRHIEQAWNLDAAPLAPFVAKYAAAVMAYLQEHHESFAEKSLAALLPDLKLAEDEDGYWRAFWVIGNGVEWNRALDEVLSQSLDGAGLRAALARRTPPPDQPGRWTLFQRTAEALYARDLALARPLIERYIDEVNLRLFAQAEQQRDEELLDFLTYRALQAMTWPLHRAFPTPSQLRWQKPDEKAQTLIAEYSAALTGRFDRLAALSPATYVEHAANTLSRFGPDESWPFRRSLQHNPVHIYLFTHHRDAWLRTPAAMRELLESPCAHVRLIGLVFLNEGGPDAARRAAENVALLRAVLLDTSHRSAKKLALSALERAGYTDASVGERVLPVLEGALHFQAHHAIDERAMVSFVRLRHALAATTAAAPTPRNGE